MPIRWVLRKRRNEGAAYLALIATAVACSAGAAGAWAADPAGDGASVAIRAHDASGCAEIAQLPSPGSDDALQRWRAVLPQCQQDPTYLAQLGKMYLDRGQYGEAADHLERALLFNPDMREARMGYAIALAGVGDFIASAALIDELIADRGLPLDVRRGLQRYNASWRVASGWTTNLSTGLRAGHDSNLSGTPRLSSLTLTLPGGTLTLPLADGGFVPQPGSYLRADARLDTTRTAADGSRWDISIGGRMQRNSAARDMESRGIDAAAERTQWLAPAAQASGRNGYYVGVSAAALRPSQNTSYATMGAGAGWVRAWQPGTADCQVRAGGEAERRRHPSNDLLTGRYAGLALSMTCQTASRFQWLAGLRRGRDRADDVDRPGGNQAQSALRAAVSIPVPSPMPGVEPAALLIDAEWSRLHDERGYNAWYDNGRIRDVRRAVARVEYQARLGAGLRAVLGAEWLRQSSTISIFHMRSSGPYGALRLDW